MILIFVYISFNYLRVVKESIYMCGSESDIGYANSKLKDGLVLILLMRLGVRLLYYFVPR